MRYAGQRWEVTVALPASPVRGDGGRELQAIFEAEYRRRYGVAARASNAVELVAIRAVGVGGAASDVMEASGGPVAARHPARSGHPRLIQVQRAGAPTEVLAFDADKLALGDTVVGPALIDNGDTTTWIPVSVEAWVSHDRTLIVETQP
jgi:N-methylhydantoinase A